MGRHHDKKYGIASGYGSTGSRRSRHGSAYGSTYGRYGMGAGGLGGLTALVPLLGLGVVVAIVFAMMRRKRMARWGLTPALGGGITTGGIAAGGIAATGVAATTGIAATNCAATCSTVGINEKLVAAERLPGVKYREVDVITRKRVRYFNKISH